MVQATLDERVLKLLDSSHAYKIFDKVLSEHSKESGFVLAGAYGGTAQIQEDWAIHLAQKHNSAFLYRPKGKYAKGQYNKIHLVPFGEVVPFRESFPWLYNLLMKFTPYDYDYTLDAGTEYTVFEMTGRGEEARAYKFSVMICYEDAVPIIARRFALDKEGQKRLDWLLNISNDGWFVRFKNEKVLPSTELAQHAAICVFRAVENRLAILRSVNTGISCLIDSLGRMRNGYVAASPGFPAKAMARRGMAGWFVDKVPIDKRVTFFSRYGQWLDFCCVAGLALLAILQALEQFGRNKSIKGKPNEKE
jgi:apolipoprotein N-acyltransferase